MRRVLNLLITLTALAAYDLGAQAPAELGAQEPVPERVHQVQPGETLSSIARAYFGELGTWRMIFEANRERIPDPNRIEPGLELVIPAGATVRSVEVSTTRTVAGAPARRVRPMPEEPQVERTTFWTGPTVRPNTVDAPLLADADEVALLRPTVPVDAYYSAGWLVEVGATLDDIGAVDGFSVASGIRSNRITASLFDRVQVVLDPGVTVRPGDRLRTFRVERAVKELGTIVVPTGMLEVEANDEDGVLAVVIEAYAPLTLGDLVKVAEPFPLEAGVMPTPLENGLEAEIVEFQRKHELQLLGDIAFLDVGAEDGVRIGDEFVAYAVLEAGWELEPVGRIQVVGLRDGFASARILAIDAPAFEVGTRVRMSRRMP